MTAASGAVMSKPGAYQGADAREDTVTGGEASTRYCFRDFAGNGRTGIVAAGGELVLLKKGDAAG